MKSIDEVFTKVWNNLGGPTDSPYQFEKSTWNRKLIEEVAKLYAKEAIEAQLEIAANEADTEIESFWGLDEVIDCHQVDKDSIRNCTRIELI